MNQIREIKYYATNEGKIPFDEWFKSLTDINAQARITLRLERVKLGNLGDSKFVGDGVFELSVDYGQGYRIYFSQIGSTIILLLCGGDKRTQAKDISKAQSYWKHYRRTNNEQ
ncbi:MAG TPA: type II toxin-antitoxin system RelE/ParE family toxin [Allocoleopsis sp.]